ncbi:MAG: hypothetical protein WCJ71_11445, partial [Candidatus Omnitrophota bacterium]
VLDGEREILAKTEGVLEARTKQGSAGEEEKRNVASKKVNVSEAERFLVQAQNFREQKENDLRMVLQLPPNVRISLGEKFSIENLQKEYPFLQAYPGVLDASTRQLTPAGKEKIKLLGQTVQKTIVALQEAWTGDEAAKKASAQYLEQALPLIKALEEGTVPQDQILKTFSDVMDLLLFADHAVLGANQYQLGPEFQALRRQVMDVSGVASHLQMVSYLEQGWKNVTLRRQSGLKDFAIGGFLGFEFSAGEQAFGFTPFLNPVTHYPREGLAHIGKFADNNIPLVGGAIQGLFGLVNQVLGGDPRKTWYAMAKFEERTQQERWRFMQAVHRIGTEKVKLKQLYASLDQIESQIRAKGSIIRKAQLTRQWGLPYPTLFFWNVSQSTQDEKEILLNTIELNEYIWAKQQVAGLLQALSEELPGTVAGPGVSGATQAAGVVKPVVRVSSLEALRALSREQIDAMIAESEHELASLGVKTLSGSFSDVLADAAEGSSTTVKFSGEKLEDVFQNVSVMARLNVHIPSLWGQVRKLRQAQEKVAGRTEEKEIRNAEAKLMGALGEYFQKRMLVTDYREMQKTEAGRILLDAQARKGASETTGEDVRSGEELVRNAERDYLNAEKNLQSAQAELS